ncbi:MAG: dihydroorotate dehydrogenase-like protein [Opitutaceae bacterium]
MTVSIEYLGLKLASPLIVGASPFADDVQTARLLQDMGAGAIVLRSLFEEQIYLDALSEAPARKTSALPPSGKAPYFPAPSEYRLTPERYLRQIADLKEALDMPVIASLNGCRPGGWIDYAARCERAGADAIEISLYQLPTDPALSALEVEAEMLETVRLVKESVRLPVAAKLSPFLSSPANFARRLEQAGASGIVLFNRMYQSGIERDGKQEGSVLGLSSASELLLRLRWLAIVSPHLKCSLAATGGVQTGGDLIKAILAGADGVQVVSALLRQGPRYAGVMLETLETWMRERGYRTIEEFRGLMNLERCADPAAFERADYQRILQHWRI